MKAEELVRTRIVHSEVAFSELVLWHLPKAMKGSRHRYKYRLAYVVRGLCVVRYDNEAGKGDHRHFAGTEKRYPFSDVDKLLADFQADIARWNRENGNS